MDSDRIAQNLACVEKHFHSEAVDEVEAALDLYTGDIIWDAPSSQWPGSTLLWKGCRCEELPRALRFDA